jgi:hypothetical protein
MRQPTPSSKLIDDRVPLHGERCRVRLQRFRVQAAAPFSPIFRVNTRPFLIDAVLPHIAVPEHRIIPFIPQISDMLNAY